MLNLTLVLLCACAPVIDDQDNPEYKQWSKYKAGTFVTMTNVTDSAGQKMEMTMTTTLKSISAKELVLETKMTMLVAGQKIDQPAQDRTVLAKIPKVDVPVVEDKETPKPKIEEGKEDVTIGTKKVAAKWVKTTTEVQGMKIDSKIWTSEDVPGGMVKMESTTSGEVVTKTNGTVTAFEIK